MTVFLKTIPILRSFDEKKAREFYVAYAGFAVDWEHRFEPGMPLYMQVSRGDLVLHVSEHHGDATPGSCVFIEMSGLRAFHAELQAKDYPNLRPGLENLPWGLSMSLTDPFGNKLRFNDREPDGD
jgi:hypothetical protein